MNYVWWSLSILLTVFSLLVAIGQWWSIYSIPKKLNAQGQPRNYSMIPLIGGAIGTVGCLISPAPSMRSCWWIPLIADPGCALLLGMLAIFSIGSGARHRHTKLIIGAILILIACLFIPAFQAAHEASCRGTCHNNLKSVAVGLACYHDVFHSLPVAAERASNGKLWRSWRSQVYPVFMESIGMFYDASSAWDSPKNLRLLNGEPVGLSKKDGTPYKLILDKVPWPFACPTSQEKGRQGTSFVVVTGSETAFPLNRAISLADVSDGPENTILVVESTNCRPAWTEPRDLDFDTMSFKVNDAEKPSISSDHTGGALVSFADGHVAFLTTDVTELEVRALLTIAGGEKILRSELIHRGAIR